jgi:hypothetical protein
VALICTDTGSWRDMLLFLVLLQSGVLQAAVSRRIQEDTGSPATCPETDLARVWWGVCAGSTISSGGMTGLVTRSSPGARVPRDTDLSGTQTLRLRSVPVQSSGRGVRGEEVLQEVRQLALVGPGPALLQAVHPGSLRRGEALLLGH